MAGPLLVLGHSLLELVVVIGLAAGAARFLESLLATFIIGVAGGVLLLWMGWGMARKPGSHSMPNREVDEPSGAPSSQDAMTVVGGALVSMSNPFWSLWWASIGLGYILWSIDLGFAGMASFYTGHILSDLVWFSAVTFAVASGRRFLTPSVYQGLILACGVFLLGMGVWFVSSGVSALREFLAS